MCNGSAGAAAARPGRPRRKSAGPR